MYPYTYTPKSNNQTGIQFDNDLPRSLNIFFLCLGIILSICCLFIVMTWKQLRKWYSNRPETGREINERRRENRRINRQSNANLTYVYPSNGNDSREEVNVNYTYPSLLYLATTSETKLCHYHYHQRIVLDYIMKYSIQVVIN